MPAVENSFGPCRKPKSTIYKWKRTSVQEIYMGHKLSLQLRNEQFFTKIAEKGHFWMETI
jgi:hypothetical protein